MKKYTTQSEATQSLAAQQTHDDMHTGRGVIAMPTHDDIANRAYDIYVKKDRQEGQCKQNWEQAEHELRTLGHRV